MITRAIGFEKKFTLNEGNQFEYFQLMVPDLLPLDVLVKVEAASVNPVDTKLRQSGKGTVPPHILGFDGVGIILEKGSEVTNFSVGDRVLYAGTTTRTGSCSNLQVVDSRIIAQVPASMTLTDAAGMPLTFITAYEALFEKMGLIPEENANVGKELLIVNGAGGVGSAAIQLAKWAGLKVIATASRAATVDWVTKLQADLVINHRHSLSAQLPAKKQDSIPYILLLHSTDDYFAEACRLIAPFGHIVSIVGTSRELHLGRLKDKAASFDWEYMFAKTDYDYHVASQGAILEKIMRLWHLGKIKPTTTRVLQGLTTETLFEAHRIVEEGKMIGKLVIAY